MRALREESERSDSQGKKKSSRTIEDFLKASAGFWIESCLIILEGNHLTETRCQMKWRRVQKKLSTHKCGYWMSSRTKLFVFIPAIILLPILLGMTPLNFIQKIGSGCPFSHGKQITSNFCPFNSIVSHDDTTVASVDSIPLEHFSLDPFSFQLSGLDSHRFDIRLSSLPLRC